MDELEIEIVLRYKIPEKGLAFNGIWQERLLDSSLPGWTEQNQAGHFLLF